MNAIIENAKDLDELSLFLSESNKRKESHIGFCGEQVEEIKQTLKEDFVSHDDDINFFIARNNIGKIIAAIGLDVDGTVAEVWGPFNQVSSIKLQCQLWEKLVNENPIIQEYYFFINKENTQQQEFMKELAAKKTGEHLTLVIKERNFNKVSEMKSTPYVTGDFNDFENLHNDTFPRTYYDARTITKRLGDGNSLKVLKNELNEFQGYAYFEVDAEMGEASLEYISISTEAQNKGLGTMLLKEVLTEMFSYTPINEIKLTVENANSQANHVYMKAGFEPKDILLSYLLKVR